MVTLVRSGVSQHTVARRYGVSLCMETISKRGLRGLLLLHRRPAGGLHAWGATITGSDKPGG